jgi:acyl transferase domain-containing protein
MGKELYHHETIFRAEIDRCASLAGRHLGVDLRKILYGDPRHSDAMKRPSIALATLFSTEYALAKLWISWGVLPSAMIGHSLGEYVAACLAGVFSLEDAVKLVAFRGMLFERIKEGAMLSVPMPAEVLSSLLENRLCVAAINAPSLCVVAGPVADIEQFERRLAATAVNSQRIALAVPAHSALLDSVLDEFARMVGRVHLRRPTIRIVSNVTGTWIDDREATDPTYWIRHLRQTVRFADGINTLGKAGLEVLLELGPGRVLTSLAKLQTCSDTQLIVPSMRRGHDPAGDITVLVQAVTQIRRAGYEVDASASQYFQSDEASGC